jgi:hypothetical protein
MPTLRRLKRLKELKELERVIRQLPDCISRDCICDQNRSALWLLLYSPLRLQSVAHDLLHLFAKTIQLAAVTDAKVTAAL